MSFVVNPKRWPVFFWFKSALNKLRGVHSSQPSREHLKFLDVVIGEIPEAVLIVDEFGSVLSHNSKMEAIFEVSQFSAGATLSAVLDALNVFSVDKIAEISVKSYSEERFSSPDIHGVEREYRMRILPMPVSDNSHWRMMMMIDITDLVSLQKQRDRTLAILTHDMRTPIASILAVCRDEVQGRSELVTNVKKQANVLLALIDDFILSIRADDSDYNTQEMLLENLLDESLYQVRELIQSRNMTLSCDIGEPVFICADARLMARVFVNLIANAVRYGLEGSEIKLAVQQRDELVTIAIENIVAAEPTLKSAQDKGFGMGLGFIRAVISGHGGHFQQNISTDAGAIASVQITLPIIS